MHTLFRDCFAGFTQERKTMTDSHRNEIIAEILLNTSWNESALEGMDDKKLLSVYEIYVMR